MRGNSHVRFSGEGAAETLPPYPTHRYQPTTITPFSLKMAVQYNAAFLMATDTTLR
jgi:hypothetical protein